MFVQPDHTVSVSVQANHTSSASLAFLFDQSSCPVEPDFDPPLLTTPLALLVSGALSLSLFLPVPVSLPSPVPVLPEVTGLLPLLLVIPVEVSSV